jgi:multicomponent Na+:H+ antiporter subunit D
VVTALLQLVLLLPLVGVVLTLWSPRARRSALGLTTSVATLAAAGGLGFVVWDRATPARLRLAGPGGVDAVLVADGLATSMVLMTSVVGVAVSAFALVEERHDADRHHPAYWPTWLVLWGALHLLFVAGDLLTAYLMLELVGIAGAALVVLGGDRETTSAGTRYFFAELVASTTVLAGIGLLWSRTGTLSFAALADHVGDDPQAAVAVGVITAGLLLKVPLVPLHFWLPPAHSLAPSAVSPALSSVVVKTAFAVVARLWFLALPALVTREAAQLLGVLGVVAIVWGSLNALRARELKLLVAHSTVAQLGFLFLLPPMAAAGSIEAWSGGVVLAIAHAVAKAAMLMAAGVIVEDAGRSAVADLGGMAARRPVALFAFGLAAVSLVGLPPTGGFVAKWYLLVASLETGQWWWIPVIVVGSLLTAGYLMRVVKRSFAPPATSLPAGSARDGRDVIALALASTTLLMGLRPTELLELVEVGVPTVLIGGG